jgi:peptide/nickel transport system substrate-binding protein
MRGRRRTAALAMCLALVVGVGVAACSSASSAKPSSPSISTISANSVLTIALPSPPTSLDPSRGSGATNVTFQDPAYQGLLHLTGNGGSQVPSLASSYKWIGTNNSRLEVVLRPGLRFSDGTPLDAAAVEASVDHFAAGGGSFSYVGQEIASMDTPNAQTIIFNLKAPDPTFPNGLAETSGLGMIISPKAIRDNANLGTTTDGAGPYELSQNGTIEGTTYTYTPNPYYYDKSAIRYREVVIKFISDSNTALAALQSGQVQVTYGEPDTYRQAKSSNIPVALFAGSTDGLWLQDDSGTLIRALGNVDVRRAMNYAIDRKAIARTVTLGTGNPTVQLAIPGTTGYLASLEKAYPYNVAKATKLMSEAGYPHGFTLTATVPTFMSTANNLAQILAAQLGRIGITLKIIGGTTFPAYAASQESGHYGATIFSLPFAQGIPSTISIAFEPNSLGNPRHESYPTVLPAAQAASMLSGTQATAAWEAINTTIVNQALEVPIETEAQIYYYTTSVQGVAQSIAINPVFMAPAK